jgi:hypothetical protein
MGCMAIRKTQGFTELWCDEPSDALGDWTREKFGEYNFDDKAQCKDIFFKILNNKALFMKGYNLVKKNFHAEGEPKRDMTLYEYIFHLTFVLGLEINIDTFPLPRYLYRELGKSGKFLMYGGSTNSAANRAVFSFHPTKETEVKSKTTQKPAKKYNPFKGVI